MEWMTTRANATSTTGTVRTEVIAALRLVFAPGAVSVPTRRLSVAPARRQYSVSERHCVIEDGLRMMRTLAPHHQLDPYVLCDVLFGERIRERRRLAPSTRSTRNAIFERPAFRIAGGDHESDLISGP